MHFLKNLFYIPKYEKGTEMHLKQVLITSIIGMVLCIGCLAGSTWAWFQTTIQSTGNEITVGAAKMTVIFTKNRAVTESTDMELGQTYEFVLKDVSQYEFAIINYGNVAGYCEINVTGYNQKDEAIFESGTTSGTLNPFDANQNENDICIITLNFTAEDNYNNLSYVVVEIETHWGSDPNHEVADYEESFLEDPAEEDGSGDEVDGENNGNNPSGDNSDVEPDNENNSGDGTEGDTGDGTEGDTGDGTEGETGDGTEGETGDGTEGDTGDGTEGETGDGTEGETGDGTEGETGDGTEGETGDGTEGETGDGTEGDTGDGTEGETGDGTEDDTGDGSEDDSGENGTDAQNGNDEPGEPSADAEEA